ncbi:hypothetical protein CISIN_1g039616mg [Citrus sinensis]|uniref:Uncharacterized protein n=1 Tax=Citrus sinensis TaxID=2711 RepID=A0A067DFK1_CITSI|nr:hypothetical protein CISIN_1g039616mg [Citrus sinensis]
MAKPIYMNASNRSHNHSARTHALPFQNKRLRHAAAAVTSVQVCSTLQLLAVLDLLHRSNYCRLCRRCLRILSPSSATEGKVILAVPSDA